MAKDLSSIKKVDTYSIVLFVLYQLNNIPEYSTLSELSYVLDKSNFLDFLDYFGGTTIKVPTKRELQTIVNALLLYQSVKLDKLSFMVAVNKLGEIDTLQLKEIKRVYGKICEIMDKFYINDSK